MTGARLRCHPQSLARWGHVPVAELSPLVGWGHVLVAEVSPLIPGQVGTRPSANVPNQPGFPTEANPVPGIAPPAPGLLWDSAGSCHLSVPTTTPNSQQGQGSCPLSSSGNFLSSMANQAQQGARPGTGHAAPGGELRLLPVLLAHSCLICSRLSCSAWKCSSRSRKSAEPSSRRTQQPFHNPRHRWGCGGLARTRHSGHGWHRKSAWSSSRIAGAPLAGQPLPTGHAAGPVPSPQQLCRERGRDFPAANEEEIGERKFLFCLLALKPLA